jgi:hypothetical protein
MVLLVCWTCSDAQTILIAASDPNIIYLLQRYAEASGFGL